MSSPTNTNPGNFANRPTEEVKAIASIGGKASHSTKGTDEPNDSASETGRNLDGTFTKGSAAAKQAGHLGGLHSHDHDGLPAKEEQRRDDAGRNADGTFTKGSEAAKAAGHKGGMH